MIERRRTASKARRVQQVKRQLFMIAVVTVIIISGVVVFLTKEKEHNETIVTASAISEVESQEIEDVVQEDIELEKEEKPEERLERVRMEATQAGYPESVIELLDKNPETVEFVENYDLKKNSEPAKSIAELKAGEIPQLLQWDERWGYASYGTDIVAVCGCGPTCLSMVFSGLTGDASLTPSKLAEYGTNHNYINEENDTKWVFMAEACEEWGISCREEFLDEEELRKELKAGNSIICSVGPGVFTKIGHFIVLAGFEDGKVIVHDPFSQINSDRHWRYDEFKDQIKNMWIYSR